MATAKTRLVTKMKLVETKETVADGVTLELNEDEACYLAAILGWKVVGPDRNFQLYRALGDAGYTALGQARSEAIREKMKKYLSSMKGTIRVEKDADNG